METLDMDDLYGNFDLRLLIYVNIIICKKLLYGLLNVTNKQRKKI